ncbi:MAG: adenosylmethionine decarboxylase [Pelagibacteraceae bacterium]|jgi:spermidine synthase
MNKVGEHITLDFLGVYENYKPEFYEKIFKKIAEAAKVEIVNISKYVFTPQGVTLLCLLKESHMSFHTFPEKGIVSFDFFTCGAVSPAVSLEILKKELPHSSVIKKDFSRDTIHHYKDIYSSEGIKKFYMVEEIIKDFKSKAGQHIEILKLKEFGNSLFIDGELQVAEKDEELYSKTFVNSGLKISNKNSSAAIIGGGDGGVARECVKNNFSYIDWFELDKEVVDACQQYLPDVFKNIHRSNNVNCIWGDAFKNIVSCENEKYDHLFIDLNDDQFCIDLAASNINEIKRITKKNGVITAQVGSKDKKPSQVNNWIKTLENAFGNTNIDEVYIPSFDCSWNFVSSLNK